MGFFDDIAPNLQGTMFGPPQPQQQKKPSILDRMLGLYGEDPNTHIPGARNEALRRGLRQGGASVLAANTPGHGGITSAQGLGMMLGGLSGAGPQMAAERKQRALQDMLSSGTASPSQLQLMAQQAIANGDFESAKLIQQMLQTRMQAENARMAGQASKARGLITEAPIGENGEMHSVLLDPTNGDILKDLGPAQPERGVVVSGADANGNPVDILVNPRTGEPIRAFSQPIKPPSLQEEGLATDATLVTNAVEDVISALDRLGRGPNFAEYELYKHNPTRAAVGDDVQALLQAQEALVSILARVVTGSVRAAASQPIRDAINRSFLVAPGDSPMNRAQTIRNLELIRDRLQTEAGRAWIRQQAGITPDMIPGGSGGGGEDISSGIEAPPRRESRFGTIELEGDYDN